MLGKFNRPLIVLLSFVYGLGLPSGLSWAAEKSLKAALPDTIIASTDPKSPHRFNIPTELEKTLKSAITTLYGESQTDEVYRQISDILYRSLALRPEILRRNDFKRHSDWYKDEIIYIAYAHGFDGKKLDLHNSSQNLESMLPYLKKIGMTTIHILPPPACYQELTIRNNRLQSECRVLKSEKTLKGLIEAIHTKKMNIEYDILDLPSPNSTQNFEFALERFPQSASLPLSSLYSLLERVSYWSNRGIDIFHLDMNGFKSDDSNDPKKQASIQLLSSFIQAIAPRSVLHVEAKQPAAKLFPYFGNQQTYTYAEHQKSKPITRTNEAQLLTHFAFTANLWSTLILESNQSLWDAYINTPPFTDKETWTFFLRNQDELNLSLLDPAIRNTLYEKLRFKGEDFENGKGISGRLADFLDNDPKRISQAFDMLLSLPGIPMIYYGDTIATSSNRNYAKLASKNTPKSQKTFHITPEPLPGSPDSRDIHRAPIEQKRFFNAESFHNDNPDNDISRIVYQHLHQSITIRQKTPALSHGQFVPVFSDERSVLSYVRYTPEQVVLVAHNLSNETIQSTLTLRKKIQVTLESPSLTNLITGESVPVKQAGQKITLTLQPHQSYWFEL